MKRTIKIFMVAALSLGSTALFAQKFGRIDYQGTLGLMPEMTNVNAELQKVAADYDEQYQSMVVERNKLFDEYQKLPETTSETSRQLKVRDIQNIEQRIQELQQLAQEGIGKAQMDLILPLKNKLDAAIKKVCKAQGIVMAFQTVPAEAFANELIYIDDSTVDINTAVRAELGIAADAVLPSTTTAR